MSTIRMAIQNRRSIVSKLTVNGIELSYETSGQGQPLLFIHGLGSSTRDWEYQVSSFAHDFQVVTFDLRGHGQSTKSPGPYTIPLFAADTAAFIRALNLGPTHVVGLSLGGVIAFQLALDAPELVKSMVIVNSGPEIPLRTFKERLRVLIGFLSRQLIVRLRGMRKMGEVLAKHLLPEPEQADLRRAFIERWAENDKRAYLAAMGAFRGWNVTDRLQAISCPVLVITADQDYTPVSFKEDYVAKMPNAELVVIPNSRHLTPLEKPELFNQALRTFLSRDLR